MESVIKQSFGINLTVMSAFGLYPPDKSNFLYKIQAYLMYSAFTLPIPILGSVYFMLDEEFDKAQIDDNAFLLAEMACQITKLLPFIRNHKKIKKCINYFELPHFTVSRHNQKEIINKSIRICKRNSLIFLISVIGGNIFWASRPFFGKEQKLPVDIWLPFNPTLDPKLFFSIYSFLVMGVGYASMACAAIDPLIGGLACLAAGQLGVLKDNLQNLSKYADEEMIKNKEISKDMIIQKNIRNCLHHHRAILKFVREYEMCFSSAVFSQFLGSILVICFCCLQLSKVQPMSFNFFSMISFLSTFLAQIYVYCYYGTVLFEESNTLANAVYMDEWYDYDVKAKKSLLILMERFKKPIIITVGKVLNVSVDTFTMILRRSYSLLAVLKNQ